MNFFGLFGGSENTGKALDTADKVLSGVGGFIDGLSYTDQEKAVHVGKAVDAHLRLVEATANENSLRSVTRRWLAWSVGGFTVFWASIGMIFAINGKAEVVDNMIKVVNAFQLGWTFLAVMGFYFGVQLLRK